MILRALSVGLGITTLLACDTRYAPTPQGDDQQDCHPNQTCNDGLTCVNDTCIPLAPSNLDSGAANVPVAPMATVDAAVNPGDGGPREVLLRVAKPDAWWANFNDCQLHPINCTKGANEFYRGRDDGTPYCTKGTTAPSDGANYGAGLELVLSAALDPAYNAAAAGVLGFAFDITGTSPPLLRLIVQLKIRSELVEFGKVPLGQRAVLLFDSPPAGTPPVDRTNLAAILLMAEVQAERAPFDFCMANVTAIEQP